MAEVQLENAPRKAREMFEKAVAAMERGNSEYAIDMFLQILALEPGLLKARKFLRAAELKLFKDKKGGGATHAISSITGMPRYLMASMKLKSKPAEAMASAEKLLRVDPLNMSFITLFAQAAVGAGMPEAAIQTLEIAKEHYPNDIKLLNWLASLYIENNQPHEARDCYETVARLCPNDQKAVKNLKDAAALDTMKTGGWEEKGDFRKKLKDQKEAILLEQQAKAVKGEKDVDALIKETKDKIAREPENMNYYRALADLFTRAERFDEALETLEGAIKATGRADPQVERGISQIRVKQFDAQIAQLREAGQTDAANAKDQEKNDFLLADATDKVKHYPNDLQFRYELGYQLYRRGQLNEAIQEFQLAQRNPQRRTRALYYLGLCFKSKGQLDIALEQLQKAVSELSIMDETKKDILYEMGIIYEESGSLDKAVALYKEIYAVDIRYRDVTERMEKAYKK